MFDTSCVKAGSLFYVHTELFKNLAVFDTINKVFRVTESKMQFWDQLTGVDFEEEFFHLSTTKAPWLLQFDNLLIVLLVLSFKTIKLL